MHLSLALSAQDLSRPPPHQHIKCVPRFLHTVTPRLPWHKAWTRRIISLAYMQTDDLHNHHRERYFCFVFARKDLHDGTKDDGPYYSLAACSLPNLSSFMGGETGAAVWALTICGDGHRITKLDQDSPTCILAEPCSASPISLPS